MPKVLNAFFYFLGFPNFEKIAGGQISVISYSMEASSGTNSIISRTITPYQALLSPMKPY